MAGKRVMVDSSVLLDILTDDPAWLPWSSAELRKACLIAPVVINPIICAEIAPSFDFEWQEMNRWLTPVSFEREALPFEASVVAAEAHRLYRQRGGVKSSPSRISSSARMRKWPDTACLRGMWGDSEPISRKSN